MISSDFQNFSLHTLRLFSAPASICVNLCHLPVLLISGSQLCQKNRVRVRRDQALRLGIKLP